MSQEPTESDIYWIFRERPDTTFVAISRPAVAWVNEVAIRTFFDGQAPMAEVHGDPEANPANFHGKLQIDNAPTPVAIHIGMRIAFTRNINKEIDYVNGMGATVTGMDHAGIRTRTDSGYRVSVFPWTEDDKRFPWRPRVVFLPLRAGYATTLLKVQGATIPHLTIWLDVPNIEAAGYVALSRVEKDANWQFVGDPSIHHFTPAGAITPAVAA